MKPWDTIKNRAIHFITLSQLLHSHIKNKYMCYLNIYPGISLCHTIIQNYIFLYVYTHFLVCCVLQYTTDWHSVLNLMISILIKYSQVLRKYCKILVFQDENVIISKNDRNALRAKNCQPCVSWITLLVIWFDKMCQHYFLFIVKRL